MSEMLRQAITPFDPNIHDAFACRCQDPKTRPSSAVGGVAQSLEDLIDNDLYCNYCGEHSMILKCYCGKVVDTLYKSLDWRMIFQCRSCCARARYATPEDPFNFDEGWLERDGTFGKVERLDTEQWPGLGGFEACVDSDESRRANIVGLTSLL